MDPAMVNGLRVGKPDTLEYPVCLGLASVVMSGGVIQKLTTTGIVKSCVQSASGVFDITFTSPQPDAKYSWAGTTSDDAVSQKTMYNVTNLPSGTGFRIQVATSGGLATTCNIFMLAIFK